MLKNRKLLIDKDCPMCNLYGKCFTKIGWIEKNTIFPYQTIHDFYATKIDMNRAKNEIALLDTTNSTTIYGIDAMIEIASHDSVLLKRILRSKIVYILLQGLYSFISYNRKVIYPTHQNEIGRSCNPDLNKTWRWTYILFVAIFTGVVLNQYAFHINMTLGWEHNWIRELYICFGQIVWQMTAISFFHKNKTLEYLGNMSTVSMIGGILLLPILILNSFFPLSLIGLIIAFGLVVGIMLLKHIRRCKLLGVSLLMTGSWIMYRTVVLILVLISQYGISRYIF